MRYFRVIGNTRYDHNFRIGQIVEFIREYEDGVYEVEGFHFGYRLKQDVHPRDLQEVVGESDYTENLRGVLL